MSAETEPIQITSQATQVSENVNSIPCGVCRRQFSRYTCPRCNIPYCSLTCFRSESHAECSEAFYREEVKSDIQTAPSKTAEERQKMMEVLKRFEEESREDELALSGADETDENDLASRLENVDLESASYDELWSALTPAERDKFLKALRDPSSELAQQLLASEELDKLRTAPWWEGPAQVEEAATSANVDEGDISKFGKRPAMMNVPASMISPAATPETGPSLLYNASAILVAYAFVTRHLGTSPLSSLGSQDADYEEARRLFSRLVPFLTDRKSKVVMSTLSAVITDISSRFEPGTVPSSLLAYLLQDAATLLRPSAVTPLPDSSHPTHESHPSATALLAFSDIAALFQTPKDSSSQSREQAPPNHVSHKLTFYAARVLSTPSFVLSTIADEMLMRAKLLDREGPTPGAGASAMPRSSTKARSSVTARRAEDTTGPSHAVIEELT